MPAVGAVVMTLLLPLTPNILVAVPSWIIELNIVTPPPFAPSMMSPVVPH
jgi:hypothetical protein